MTIDALARARRRGTRSNSAVLLLAMFCGALVTSGVTGLTDTSRPAGVAVSAPGTTTAPLSPVPSNMPPPPATPDGAGSCAGAIAALTTRQRLGQLVMVGVPPTNPAAAAAVVRSNAVGGIFVGGTATNLLVNSGLAAARAEASVPLFVAVDEEGGRVQRIDALDGDLPSARMIANTMTPDQARILARIRGNALRNRGVTVNFAPVADVTEQPNGAVIGDRSFGSDPDTVTAYARAFAQGLRDAGVLPVVKHFPGHGHASGDSHRTTVTTPNLDGLRAVDLRPYRELLGSQPVAVMIGHLDVPDLTDSQPASLSPATYRLLRTEYAFNGLAITDDLGDMRAVTSRQALPAAVLLALAAGADVAFWSSGEHLAEVLDTLENALTAGRLSAARVEEALRRVLHAKAVCVD